LAEMQIPVPPLNVQQKIAETAGLAVRERILTERLASLKWKHTKSLLSRAANDHSETNPKEPSK
jgi:restriction endonuclease S subunit